MIGWDDIYKVITSMFPLYVALMLGYGSVKWWHMFNPDHCDAINQLNCYFIMPLFQFNFTTKVNPYKMNFRFLGADAISKALILITISSWAKFTTKGNYPWSITSFSLSSLSNTLVVGVPLIRAMYGPFGENLVIQSSIVQFTVWIINLLLMYEFWSANKSFDLPVTTNVSTNVSTTDLEGNNNEDVERTTRPSLLILMKIVGLKLAKNPNSYACIVGLAWALVSYRWDVKMPSIIEGSVLIMSRAGSGVAMFCMGLFMALQRKIIDCGVTLAVYGMLLRFVVAPASMAVSSLIVGLRGDVLCIAIIQVLFAGCIFIVWVVDDKRYANDLGPSTVHQNDESTSSSDDEVDWDKMLHGQPNDDGYFRGKTTTVKPELAALPQAIASFVFAKEYQLHTNVLSTAVIFGTIVSIPVLISYFVVLDILNS